MNRRIISVTTAFIYIKGNGTDRLVALCDDGTVWYDAATGMAWPAAPMDRHEWHEIIGPPQSTATAALSGQG